MINCTTGNGNCATSFTDCATGNGNCATSYRDCAISMEIAQGLGLCKGLCNKQWNHRNGTKDNRNCGTSYRDCAISNGNSATYSLNCATCYKDCIG